ncbi:MAG: ElyC/SanA/YdcF family protein [Vicinamibacterales bacterium]
MARPTRGFWFGVLLGMALLLAARWAVNESTIPDRLVAPLLVGGSKADADAIVVLGGGVIGECEPNLNSLRRAIRGARLYREGRAPLLVITGGAADGGCPVSEGMRDVVRELGVPDARILVERTSRSTRENGERAAPTLRALAVQRILLVTDRLHMTRAAGVFESLGFVVEPSPLPVYEGHEDNVSMLAAGVRELAALAYYRARGWMAPPAETPDGPPVDAARASLELPEPGTGPVVLLGASYAANWAWDDLAPGVPVVNAGVPGQQSFELLERFDRDVVSRRPRAVVIWGFINDIFRASDAATALARARQSIEETVRRARAAGIEPILATEVTIRPRKTIVDSVMSTVGWLLGRTSNQDLVNQQVRDVNQWMREFAGAQNILVLDLERVLAGADGRRLWAFAVEDGSHISPEGYRALTDYARPILIRHLRLGPATGTGWQGR